MAKKKKKKKQAVRRNKQLRLAATKLRKAFEQRKLGAYLGIFELWDDIQVNWNHAVEIKRKLTASPLKLTAKGVRETRRLLQSLRGYLNHVAGNAQYTRERINDCTNEIDDERNSTYGLPTLDDCYKQLEALKREFGDCQLNANNCIVIPSHEVVLDGLYFGRYWISLHLARIASGQRVFYTIAPVSLDCPVVEEHCHPHVSGGVLCEGDGDEALTKAFNAGRLYDCCLLINNILRTYNPASPYIELERFRNEPQYHCEDCGIDLDEDSRFYCENCNEDRCQDCMSYCRPTGTWICNLCMTSLKEHQEYCSHNCGYAGGTDCLIRQNAACPECGEIVPDSELARCQIKPNEPQLCKRCAKSLAEKKTPCSECLMHGYMGCALIEFGYPILNTLNHPAYVEVNGNMHKHHHFGWHPASLLHTGQEVEHVAEDFNAYRDHRLRGDATRIQRQEQLTMSHRQHQELTNAVRI